MPFDPSFTFYQLLGAFGTGGLMVGGIVLYLVKAYIPAYLSKKAENLATREDIAAITREVERIKNEFTVPIEELKAHHQLRMAALSERLRVQQQAFSLWRSLNRAAHDRDDQMLGQRIDECQKWWEENCLYLNAESREHFQDAYWAAQYFRLKARSALTPEQEIKVWERLSRAGEVIVRSVDLPSLGKGEARDVTSATPGDA